MRPTSPDQPSLGAGGRAEGVGTVGGASARGEVVVGGVTVDGVADGVVAVDGVVDGVVAVDGVADGVVAVDGVADGVATDPESEVFRLTRAVTTFLAACALSFASSRPRAASRFTSGLSASSVT
jgi:hypothetical protein